MRSRLIDAVCKALPFSVRTVVATICVVGAVVALDPAELSAWGFSYKARPSPEPQIIECSPLILVMEVNGHLAFITRCKHQ